VNARPQSRREPAPRIKCLIVDDLGENLLALSEVLSDDDVDVLEARSGREALELLLLHDVALVVLDVQMPEMDGFEVAELMRGSERTRHVPIIFVTAGVRDRHYSFKGYVMGAVDFLYKPLEPRVLRTKADVFFQLYRQKQQLAEQLRELTETLRLNEMFTAVLGHDLRNPLTAILTTSDALLRGSGDERVQRAAKRVQSSGKRMGRMIEDMLDLARARLAGGIPLACQTTHLGELLQRVVQEHQVACPDLRIELVCDGDLVGQWDPDRLAQVASNLIGNAIQHGDRGEPVRVHVCGTEADRIVLSVGNAGGVPADLLPHLFDPFRGSPQAAGRKDGLGLGLYIVQQIVHAHRGDIRVDATPSHTTFVISVPRA
jgi:signal transduction histidine kinase